MGKTRQAFETNKKRVEQIRELSEMKRSLINLTVLAALAGPVTATAGFANEASDAGANSLQAERMFERFDRNNDSQITRAEAREALSARFDRMDTNNDGTVTRNERRALRKDRGFRRMDVNGDGAVTLTEMEADMMRRVQRRFARLDADGNGLVTQDEAQAANAKRKARQSAMTLQDLDARVMRMFDRADQNRDGVITLNEAILMRRHGQRN